jgi:hypothetical protein
VICVAGMPRSGTSLVTQLLNRCGVSLGPAEQLMPADINNTDGFWENLRFVRLNERLLAASGGSWCAPPVALRPTPAITAEARSIVAQFDAQEPWAWKDPRNAFTLPFWKTLLPSMKVLVCVRHPAETAASLLATGFVPRTFYWTATRPDSLIRLNGGVARFHRRLWGVVRTSLSAETRRTLATEFALDLWRAYNTGILRETCASNRLVTHYEAVLTNPRAELERILAFAGIQRSPAVLDEAARVVSPRLRHQRAEPAKLHLEIDRLYAQLSREAEYAAPRDS